MEFEEDWLSSLPKIILHRILSRLPEKDRARTSVLSKAWLDTWYTFPILTFSDIKILGLPQPIEDSVRKREILEFCGYVKRSMLKFRDQSLTIKEFKLHVLRLELRHISKDINIWLKLACECGVEVIQYYQNLTRSQDQYDYHALPRCVIEAKSLTKLVLEGFIKIDPIFTNHSIKFLSLRELSLRCVLLGDEHVINHLISFCHLIEYITLDKCKVISSSGRTREYMKSCSISNLQKLKSIEAYGIKYISIDRCRNLKELCLQYAASTIITDK